jgi:uncharacterized protein (TIGR00369 family)
MNKNPQEVIDSFGETFHSHLGYEMVRWEDGLAIARLEITQKHLNIAGRVHGGVFCSLLDIVCGFCGNYDTKRNSLHKTVTLSLTTSFIDTVNEGIIEVVGRRTGGGYKTYFAEAHAKDEDGKLLATATGVFKSIK